MNPILTSPAAYQPLDFALDLVKSLNQLKLQYGQSAEVLKARKALEELRRAAQMLKLELTARRKARKSIHPDALKDVKKSERENEPEAQIDDGPVSQDDGQPFLDELL